MDVEKCKEIIKLALKEDIGTGDITASLIPEDQIIKAKIITREDAIICGCSFVDAIFGELDPKALIKWFVKDGDAIKKNQTLCELEGQARALLTGERTALNFLQALSGTATLTKKFVEKIQSTKAVLLDTRKTIPGMRLPQKYAVVCGGGANHRFGLYDAFLIKENHIQACGSITKAVHLARELHEKKTIEVEVKNMQELAEALALKIDIIMLDNFNLEEIKEAVNLNFGKVKLEVSGGVNLENIGEIAKTGIDYISVGALTKNIIPIDLSMLFT
jgi:nicotinate-nucleotide pyrophosphorylase (carboxylating)